jgi:hypothetical protein
VDTQTATSTPTNTPEESSSGRSPGNGEDSSTSPENEETTTATATESAGEEHEGTVFVSESFTDSTWSEGWDFDENEVTHEDSYLVLSSDGGLTSSKEFEASGEIRIKATFEPRSPDYNAYNVGISEDAGNSVMLKEHNWYNSFRSKVHAPDNDDIHGNSAEVADPNGTERRDYEIDIDFENKMVTRLQRDSEEWDVQISFEGIFQDTFRLRVNRETTDTGVDVELHRLVATRL